MGQQHGILLTLAILYANICVPEWAHLEFACPSVKEEISQAAVCCSSLSHILHEQLHAVSLVYSVLRMEGSESEIQTSASGLSPTIRTR